MNEPRQLPIDTQTFDLLRKTGSLYVDKTLYIERLLALGRIFFLSRPHRFGKSLFLSTLQAYFEGRKELFEGLYIAEHEEEIARRQKREPWVTSPVFYLELNAESFTNPDDLANCLNTYLISWESRYGSDGVAKSLSGRFKEVVKRAYEEEQKPVVILIDEYDKPLLETLENEELNEKNRKILRAFYEVLKHCDAYIRFAFLTGITKFSKTTIFSSVNNLKDITLLDDYDAICGFTEEELSQYFIPEIQRLAEAQETSVEETRETLRKKYDGYRFSEKSQNVYNPFSLLNVLSDRKYGNYWFENATPNYVVQYIKQNSYPIPKLENGVAIYADDVQDFRYGLRETIPLLFQSGYLTIKQYHKEDNSFILGFPNEEVHSSFLKSLLPVYSYIERSAIKEAIDNLYAALMAGDTGSVLQWVSPMLAAINYGNIPNDEKGQNLREYYYQSVISIYFYILRIPVQTEVVCATGRMDMVVTNSKHIYIFEFKTNALKSNGEGSAADALRQIKEKNYHAQYRNDGRPIHLVGVSFDEKTRNIGDWKEEILPSDGCDFR